MKKGQLIKLAALFLGMLLISMMAGCGSEDKTVKTRAKVTKEKVAEFQKQKKQKRTDIYVPIKEQFAASKHNKSLQTLLKSKQKLKPNCFSCMSGDYFLAPQNKKPDPKTVKFSVTCADCHELTVNEFKLRRKPLDTCTSCHWNGGEILPGQVVHHPQKEMFLGIGAIGVPQIPDSKYKAGLTCIECHMPNEAHTFVGKTPAQALKENTESICIMCHADQSEEEFAKEVTNIQNKIETDLKKLKTDMNKSQLKLERAKKLGYNVTVAQNVYNIIFTNLSFLENDKSKGIHNFDYAKKIIEVTSGKEKDLEKLLAGY